MKKIGERGGDVGEGFAGAESVGAVAVEDDERDFFARVIGAVPGRVVAVVGGEDDEIGGRDIFPLVPKLQLGHATIPKAVLRRAGT